MNNANDFQEVYLSHQQHAAPEGNPLAVPLAMGGVGLAVALVILALMIRGRFRRRALPCEQRAFLDVARSLKLARAERHFAWQLAKHHGCDPVAILLCDSAYASAIRSYADDAPVRERRRLEQRCGFAP